MSMLDKALDEAKANNSPTKAQETPPKKTSPPAKAKTTPKKKSPTKAQETPPKAKPTANEEPQGFRVASQRQAWAEKVATFSISLPISTKQAIASAAKAQGVTFSKLIVQAMCDQLGIDKPAPRANKHPPRPKKEVVNKDLDHA